MLPPFDFAASFGVPRVLPTGEEVFEGGSGLSVTVRYGPDGSVHGVLISEKPLMGHFQTPAAD
jgi:hypothetical protein